MGVEWGTEGSGDSDICRLTAKFLPSEGPRERKSAGFGRDGSRRSQPSHAAPKISLRGRFAHADTLRFIHACMLGTLPPDSLERERPPTMNGDLLISCPRRVGPHTGAPTDTTVESRGQTYPLTVTLLPSHVLCCCSQLLTTAMRLVRCRG